MPSDRPAPARLGRGWRPVRRRAPRRRRALRGRDPAREPAQPGGRRPARRPADLRRAHGRPRRRGRGRGPARRADGEGSRPAAVPRRAPDGPATRDDVEGAARSWLAEINEINQEHARGQRRGPSASRAAATALAPTLERLAVEADAARISAERADEACVAAREALAACDEARTLEAAAVAAARDPGAAEPAERPTRGERGLAAARTSPRRVRLRHGLAGRPGRADPDPDPPRRPRRDAAAVARLAGADAEATPPAGRRLLGGLADALIARSIEASAFDFPLDHFFWGPFNQSQNRDIAAGSASLGFRFDGFGGWVDERVPSQRDLSMAVGYAGEDPMRIRRWPTEAEMQRALRGRPGRGRRVRRQLPPAG